MSQEQPADDSSNTSADVTRQPVGEFRVGDVLSAGFGALFSNFGNYTLVAGVVYLPLIIAALLIDDGISFILLDFNQVGWAGYTSGMFLAVMLGFVAYAAVVFGALEQEAGNKIGALQMLRGGLAYIIPVLIASCLITLLFLLGLILLVIPGIIIMLALEATIPAIVAENRGPIEAMKRSAELASGYKWHILGVVIVVFFVQIVFSTAINFIPEQMQDTNGYIGMATYFIENAVSTALGGTIAAAIYTRLRPAKEGVLGDDIAEVFA